MISRLPRRRRLVRRIGVIALATVIALIAGAVVWTSIPAPTESGPLARVRQDPKINYRDTPEGAVLTPTGTATGIGLVFYAGWRVAAPAYAWKLSGLVDAGTTVVIVQPPLNLAIVDTRPLSTFTDLAPNVTRWFVGGHSLGGMKASLTASDNRHHLAGLILLGSYSLTDLSHTGLPVLSIGSQNDGLFAPNVISNNAHLLPPSTTFVEIPGANHAQFGNYGPQPGDKPSTAQDADVRTALTRNIQSFLTLRPTG